MENVIEVEQMVDLTVTLTKDWETDEKRIMLTVDKYGEVLEIPMSKEISCKLRNLLTEFETRI
jgi:hypothetical protein